MFNRNIKMMQFSLVSTCFVATLALTMVTPAHAQEIDYLTDVQPILDKHCLACHNEDDSEGGFIATSFETISEGHDNGDSFVASESQESTIVRLMNGDDEPLMPPDDRPRPTEEEIATIARWIDKGAKPSAIGPPTKKAKPTTPFSLSVPKLGRGETSKEGDGVTAADWSPTDSRIATGSFQRVTVSASVDHQLVEMLGGIVGKVNSLRFSSDGKWLVASSGVTGKAGQAIIWDVGSGSKVQMFNGHADYVYAAVISPDKTTLATSSYDRKIILWNIESGQPIRELTGHNGAIYDIDFSPDGKALVSASADQTLKLWDVASGERLETFGQPLKEQLACRFSPDGKSIVGAGRDSRIRIWNYARQPSANVDAFQLSVFAHEGPIVALDYSADGSRLASTSEDHTTKIWDASSFEHIQTIRAKDGFGGATSSLDEVVTALAMSPDGTEVFLGNLLGVSATMTVKDERAKRKQVVIEEVVVKPNPEKQSSEQVNESEPNDEVATANRIAVGNVVTGKIAIAGAAKKSKTDADLFRFPAKKGQRLVLETKAARDGVSPESKLDSKIEILNEKGIPVPRVLLQATLDSYFTFRGKDSDNTDDIRVHNWREMDINQYLFCNGEVVRLFQHPRGPDSGFLVYPGTGKRMGYFGTTPIAHPLHEPCYLVKPYPVGTTLPANGLPTFTINYENDDSSTRDIGKDSRLLFAPPADGIYFVRVSDVRGFSGDDFTYELSVSHAEPSFSVSVKAPKEVVVGGGQEFELVAKRIDGYDGPIKVEIGNVPEGLKIASPVVIEAGHERAFGSIQAMQNGISKDAIDGIVWKASSILKEQNFAGAVGKPTPFEVKDNEPKIELRITRSDSNAEAAFDTKVDQPLVFQIRPGEMIEAKVVAKRNNHNSRISLGMADAGRNLPRGVYVDDIGLNGLMITKKKTEQVFYITCDEWVGPQKRFFHVRASDVGNEISWPVIIEVLPKIR